MEKKIVVKITPAAVLLAVLVLLAALFLTRGDGRVKRSPHHRRHPGHHYQDPLARRADDGLLLR